MKITIKRQTFASTQASQAVASENYTSGIYRTAYHEIMAQRTSELYSKVAKENGKVVEVTADLMKIKYDDGVEETYPLGLYIGEAAGEHHRHTRVTDLKAGDKFTKGDVIGWDTQWFERDVFNPGQAVLKWGKMVRIVLVDHQDTYEDSLAISKELAEESITPYIKPKRFSIRLEQLIDLKVKVGDEVDIDQILCDVEDPHVGVGIEADENPLAGEINRFGIQQVRSNHHGKVIRIECMYNGDKEEMSPSVQKLVTQLDRERKQRTEREGKPVATGRVSSGRNVARPMIAPGKVMITIYVESRDYSTSADKYALGNQMKGTAGRIMDMPLYTQDGRVIDLKFSFKGKLNRMVLSLRDKAATNELSIGFTRKALEVYRGKG